MIVNINFENYVRIKGFNRSLRFKLMNGKPYVGG